MAKPDVTHTTIGLAAVLVTFFVAPYIPGPILRLTDLFVVRLALLGVFLMLAVKQPLIAIVYFLMMATLFVERNKLKLQTLQASMTGTAPTAPAIQGIVSAPLAPPQPEFQTPSESTIPFVPQDDSGDNTFAPVSATINHKRVLPTETVDGSDKAHAQLFSWVNPSLAQGSD